MAMSLVHGGSGFPFISPCVFKYLCGENPLEISVETSDVADMTVRAMVDEVKCLIILYL